MAKESDFGKLRVKVTARAWKDPAFRERLKKNPRAAFKEMGYDAPPNFDIRVVEDKTKPIIVTIVLPPSGTETRELSDQEIEKIAGAGTGDCCWTPITG